MDFNLDRFLKKYVWDEEKTPYLTAVPDLNVRQARYELLSYSVFLALLFGAVCLTSLTGWADQPRSVGTALYALSVICAAVVLAFIGHYFAALYVSTAPLGAVAYLALNGVRSSWGVVDFLFIAVFILLWVRYSFRVVAIGRRFDQLE